MPSNYLKTSQIAKAVGVHPNTVRLYEEWGLLMPVSRNDKGYRLYTSAHLEQMRLARLALRCEFIAGRIRGKATHIVKLSAAGKLQEALEEAYRYRGHILSEKKKAEEALEILMSAGDVHSADQPSRLLKRKEAAALLGISIDVLRNWELNGLVEIPRNDSNRYRLYSENEIRRMKIISTLRSASYSMMAILRLLTNMDRGLPMAMEQLKAEERDEDIRYATDRWLATLEETEKDAEAVIQQIHRMLE